MNENPFIGRQLELGKLNVLLDTKRSNLVVIKGRRRIGKSRLAQEFAKRAKGYQSFYFTALPPERGVTSHIEREDFAYQMAKEFSIPAPRADDWNTLLWAVAREVKGGKCIIIFDEINWMGSKDAAFLGKLKSAWDREFSQIKDLVVILSGSLTRWIDKNILHSTGFLGRISLDITLGELPLVDCAKFWGKRSQRVTAYEKLKILAVTGGIPRYLEEIRVSKTADENIRRMCFDSGGLLFREFDNLFDDLFARRNSIYRHIVTAVANGPINLAELYLKLSKTKKGKISEYVDDLEQCGFLSRDYTWKIKDGQESRLSRIRLKDNYLRFYIKGIQPHRRKIERGALGITPNYTSLLGLQFENIVLSNRHALWEKIGISVEEIVMENPFFQSKTSRQKGCQIDYMIQTKSKTLYVCEFKFLNKPIDQSIINEVGEKIERLSKPKHFSYRPILVHVNGVSDSVIEQDYFDEIIDFGDLFDVSF